MKTITVYNENCVMAGRPVPQREIERNPESWDWHEEELTEENAAEHEELGNGYHRRIAETIRDALR